LVKESPNPTIRIVLELTFGLDVGVTFTAFGVVGDGEIIAFVAYTNPLKMITVIKTVVIAKTGHNNRLFPIKTTPYPYY
jgi:hypothetical protein